MAAIMQVLATFSCKFLHNPTAAQRSCAETGFRLDILLGFAQTFAAKVS